MPPSFRRFPVGARERVCVALALALLAGCGTESRPPVRNHAAKQAYLITLKIENPPAPVTAIEGHASYQVMNKQCLPDAPFSGYTTGVWNVAEPVQFRPVSPNVWEGIVYADLYLDQAHTDDLGVCDWEFIAAGADFVIKGVRFAASLEDEEVLAQRSHREYFRRIHLDDPRSPDPSITISRISGELRAPPDTVPIAFTVVLASKEAVR